VNPLLFFKQTEAVFEILDSLRRSIHGLDNDQWYGFHQIATICQSFGQPKPSVSREIRHDLIASIFIHLQHDSLLQKKHRNHDPRQNTLREPAQKKESPFPAVTDPDSGPTGP